MSFFFDITKTAAKLILTRGSIRSFSQFGEDVVVSAFLRSVRKGFYVDIGAFHPVQYSNTYLLYKRGWRGIAIDPSARAQKLFEVFRRRDTFYATGVGEHEGVLTYIQFDDPAYNTLHAAQAEEWKSQGRKVVKEEVITVTTLRAILIKEGVDSIDLLSIDAEGTDAAILRSHDWDIPTRVVVVEDHQFDVTTPGRSEVYAFLHSRGYVLRGLCGPSLIFEKKF
jgi:FkbM family methyltransferase